MIVSKTHQDFVTKRASAPITKRKKRYTEPLFRKRPINNQPRAIEQTQSSIIVGIADPLLALLCLILTIIQLLNFSPAQIKDLILPESYLSLLICLFGLGFYLIKIISKSIPKAFFISFFCCLLIFFRLVNVQISFSLLLPLLVIFVIIEKVYSKIYQA